MEKKNFNVQRWTRWMVPLFTMYATALVVPSWVAGVLSYGRAVAMGTALATLFVLLFRSMMEYCVWCTQTENRTLGSMTRFGLAYALFLFGFATVIPTTMKLAGLTIPLKGICGTMFFATPTHAIAFVLLVALFPAMHLAQFGWSGSSRKMQPALSV